MAKTQADQKIADDETALNADVEAVEATEAPADTPAEVPAPATTAPEDDVEDQAVAADEAQVAEDEAKLTADQAADAAEDATPVQEAASQVSNGPGQIDGSGIGQQTNQEVIDNLPTNENGQVVIDSNGQVVGLDSSSQPSPQPGSQA